MPTDIFARDNSALEQPFESDLRGYASREPNMLSDILNQAPCGFVSFASDGTITLVNETLLALLGRAYGELIGQSVEMIFTLGTKVFYQTHVLPLVETQGAAQEVFLLLQSKVGRDVGVLANVQRRTRNDAIAYDCIFMPVVERRRYEDALVQAKRDSEAIERERVRADEASRAKSAFLANMSHELRTPLNAIGGYIQLMELGVHGPVSDEQRDVLLRIQRSHQHLLGLINDVLNLSRIEAGQIEYRIETVSITEVLQEVMPMVEPQLGAKGLTYTVNIPEEVCARADRDRLQQILINLLSNAIKFTPRDGHVMVDTGRRNPEDNRLFLRVSDTGVGIPRDRLENVFEPFVQVGGEARPSEGTGLGLAISRDLARGMGGDLRARSVLGTGSVFTITLPIAEQDEEKPQE